MYIAKVILPFHLVCISYQHLKGGHVHEKYMHRFNVLMDALIGLMVLLTAHVHGLTGSTSLCTLYISIQHQQHEIGAQTFAYTLVKGVCICERIRYI